MITDQDITKLKEVFATKEELSSFQDHVVKHMATKEELKTEIGTLRNEMLTGFDRILGAIQDIRDDNAAAYERFNRHETWIKNIANHVDYELAD